MSVLLFYSKISRKWAFIFKTIGNFITLLITVSLPIGSVIYLNVTKVVFQPKGAKEKDNPLTK